MFNIFDLFATIKLDTSDFERKVDEAEGVMSGIGSKLSSGLATAAKVGTAAVGAAATAVGALAKQSVGSYKEYEQLVGGVETLFGDSAQKVLEDSKNAFTTAGMSMNEYMETSIQSAAALINSLGGDQATAAELMNVSIVDMSDNVNKMGTTMEAVQNAYRGFSRGNFTMLDNLALGFSGTKEGMQELLDKAEEISGVKYDINSYSDIVKAIHEVQTAMGITGTTASEAADTVAGSAGSMQAAWQNLVTGLADKNADLPKLVGDVVASAKVMIQNVIPVFKQAIVGIGDFVKEVAPVIAEELPALVDDVLPSLLEAAGSLLEAVIESVPSAVMKLVTTISDTIVNNLSSILDSADKMITTLVEEITTNLPKIIDSGMKITNAIISGISNMLPKLIPAAVEIILALVEGFVNNLPQMIDAGIQLIVGLIDGLIEAIPMIIDRLPEIILAIVNAFIESAPKIAEAGAKLFGSLVNNLPDIIASIVSVIPSIISSIVSAFGEGLGAIAEVGKNLIGALGDGIMSMGSWVVDKAKGIGDSIVGGFKSLFGIASPSKVFMGMGNFLMQGMAEGIEGGLGLVQDAMDDLDDILDYPDDALSDMETSVSVMPTDNGDVSNGYNNTSRVEMLLQEILESLSGIGVTIDGTTLVGSISHRMNQEFGVIEYYQEREAWV